MIKFQNGLAAFVGALGVPAFEFLYGTGRAVTTIVVALVFFIAMDWLSGTRAAKKDMTYASKYGLDGLFRTFFILLLPAGGHLLDQVLGADGIIFGIFSFGVLYHTLQSMTANALRAGWADYFPEWIIEPVLKWVRSELEQKIQRATGRLTTTNPNQGGSEDASKVGK
ncbi:phage holin family protein [Paenibacillus sp. UNC496MF]|uniref:phage holin family protein n=1 Tax=Paenibacillus sp. UNC496MF TaxID=1502753 RepID=UPI000B2FE7DC|nr:phage holin family protein [Paenibacillus sp. UNC496MF]